MKKILFILLLLFLNTKLFASESILNNEEINYKAINKQLTDIQKDLTKKDIKSKDTDQYIKVLSDIQDNVSQSKKEAEKNLNLVEKRIEALGEAPKDGEKEEYSISSKRKEFAKEESLIKSKITEGELVLTKIEELEKLIIKIRNKSLLNTILERQSNTIFSRNFIYNTNSFFKFSFDIIKSPLKWFNDLSENDKLLVKSKFTYISFIVFLSCVFAIVLNIFIRKYLGYKKKYENPDYSKKFFAGLFLLIAYGIVPASILGIFLFWIKQSTLINTGLFPLVISNLLLFLLYIFISISIVSVVFVPKNSKWRLINFDDCKAKSVSFILSLSIILIAIITFFEIIAIKAQYSTELIIYIKLISCLIKTICIVLITQRIFKEKAIENLEEKNENLDNDDDNYGDLSIFDKLRLTIYFFAIIIVCISLFGYINLSDFILDHMIITTIMIGLAYIISNTIEVLFHKFLTMKFLTKNLKFKHKTLNKIDVWFSIIINPIIILITIFILLGIWGLSTDLLLQNIKKFLTGFYIGGIKISITSILLGILVYFISMYIFKLIKIKLLNNKFEKIDYDYGTANSLSAGFSFFGFLISLFLAIAVMGVSLSNLTIIAGALSFGVGLGLQNIVNNFVSGVLILFERPIKIGDIVNINGQEGVVKQISIRATELETGTKSSVIIPNANIISGLVVNMTHNNKQTRIDLRFLVDINNDPKEVMDILLSIATGNKKILPKPGPYVAFNDFSNNCLDFTLNCYINDISNKQNIVNDLRIGILNKFKENSIKTAIPQRITYVENINQNNI